MAVQFSWFVPPLAKNSGSALVQIFSCALHEFSSLFWFLTQKIFFLWCCNKLIKLYMATLTTISIGVSEMEVGSPLLTDFLMLAYFETQENSLKGPNNELFVTDLITSIFIWAIMFDRTYQLGIKKFRFRIYCLSWLQQFDMLTVS